MPHQELGYRRQKAVLWPFDGTSYDNYGQPKIGEPVQLRVRWVTARREVKDAQGNNVALDATAIVDRKITVGSTMALGDIGDWLIAGTDNASAIGEIMQDRRLPRERDD